MMAMLKSILCYLPHYNLRTNQPGRKQAQRLNYSATRCGQSLSNRNRLWDTVIRWFGGKRG